MRICLIIFAGTLLGASLVAAPQTTRLADTAAAVAVAPTFYKDVLPVLQKNCQSCHRPGEVAPMSLLTYEQARPWARAIKTAVATRQMPPWFADPAYGHFANERRLTTREIEAINGWVDARRARRQPERRAAAAGVRERLEHQARHRRRDAEAVRDAGLRHHQLQVHRREGRTSPKTCG